MNAKPVAFIILAVIGVVFVFYILYILLATSLYLARAAGRDGPFLRLISRLFRHASSEIDSVRESFSPEQLERTDRYLRRALARMWKAAMRTLIVAGAILVLLIVIKLFF